METQKPENHCQNESQINAHKPCTGDKHKSGQNLGEKIGKPVGSYLNTDGIPVKAKNSKKHIKKITSKIRPHRAPKEIKSCYIPQVCKVTVAQLQVTPNPGNGNFPDKKKVKELLDKTLTNLLRDTPERRDALLAIW